MNQLGGLTNGAVDEPWYKCSSSTKLHSGLKIAGLELELEWEIA